MRKALHWNIWITALLVLWSAVLAWHVLKPPPPGLAFHGPMREAGAVEFLADLTWVDDQGRRQTDQQIFDRKLALIDGAERLIVLDMFLFNQFAGDPDGANTRPLVAELTAALIRRRQQRPELQVIFITDPINTLYGGIESPQLEALRAAGVDVVMTDIDPLRDSNPLWSATWRLCCRWFGNSSANGWLPNPVGDQQVSVRTWLRIANFKANHRKTLVVDDGQTWTALVTSANPHDASGEHGNTALVVSGQVALDVLASEAAVAHFSDPGLNWPSPPSLAVEQSDSDSGVLAQALTEAAIREASIAALDAAGPGSRVDLAMFYLSHRGIIRALTRAERRGACVRVLLDPSQHAFGRRKNGVPNRPVAAELMRHGIAVRWCHTSGEQCHSKQLLVRYGDGTARLIGGSANFTRRNIDNFNLESALALEGHAEAQVMVAATAWFEQRWSNEADRSFSLPYDHYLDERRWRYWQYRIMEASGLSTF
ncbi:MAG: phospholipase D family protein [Gammaproteobacteria bacterium]|nr:phospholipase D family protein [Gammaproteobacteria bacterium]